MKAHKKLLHSLWNRKLRGMLTRHPGARVFCISSGVRAGDSAQPRMIHHVGSCSDGRIIVIEYYE